MVSMTHYCELSINWLRKHRSIQVLVGATLFRFESCRAHHIDLQHVPAPKGSGFFS